MTRRERELARLVAPLSWRVEGQTGGNHIRLLHITGARHSASLTPSARNTDRRMLSNLRRILRRAGEAA